MEKPSPTLQLPLRGGIAAVHMKRGSFILGLAISTCVHGALFVALREGLFGDALPRAVADEGFATTLTFTPPSQDVATRAAPPAPAPPPLPQVQPSAPIPPPPPPQPPLEESPEPPPPTEPQPLKAGIDEGAAEAKSWQGFKEETPNAAPISQVEQSAMTPQRGLDQETVAPLPEAPSTVATAVATPVESASPTPAPLIVPAVDASAEQQLSRDSTQAVEAQAAQPTQEAVPAVDAPKGEELRPETEDASRGSEIKPAQDLRPAMTDDELAPEAAAGIGTSDETAPAVAPPPSAPAPLEDSAEVTEREAVEPSRPTKTEAQRIVDQVLAESQGRKPSVEGQGLGEIEPEESDASALKASLAVEPGKTLARDGIQVRTVRPKWSITTKITAIPRNPLIDVTFDRTGKVSKAAFVAGRNTGYREVDGPLLDSIYRWRASGEKFEKSVTESGTLSLRFKMLLKEEDDSNRLPVSTDKAQ